MRFVGASPGGGFSMNRRTLPLSSVGTDAIRGGVGHGSQDNRGQSLPAPVEVQHLSEIHVGQHVTIENKERLTPDKRFGVLDRSRRIERLRLVGDLDTEPLL